MNLLIDERVYSILFAVKQFSFRRWELPTAIEVESVVDRQLLGVACPGELWFAISCSQLSSISPRHLSSWIPLEEGPGFVEIPRLVFYTIFCLSVTDFYSSFRYEKPLHLLLPNVLNTLLTPEIVDCMIKIRYFYLTNISVLLSISKCLMSFTDVFLWSCFPWLHFRTQFSSYIFRITCQISSLIVQAFQ